MKTRRNLIPICLLWAALLPAVVNAQFTFTTNNGAITITGYTGSEGTLVIPDTINGYPVAGIGGGYGGYFPGVFSDANLTNVVIPSSVTNIISGTFAYNGSLTAILVDAQNSFYSSTNGILFDKPQATLVEFPVGLAGSYVIPDSVTNIGSEAFDDCGSLTNITIGTNVISIGTGAFSYCFGLTSIAIPASVANIPSGAFVDCYNLTNITIAANVTSIGDDAFASCSSLTGFTIPNSVTNVGGAAFSYCGSLTHRHECHQHRQRRVCGLRQFDRHFSG